MTKKNRGFFPTNLADLCTCLKNWIFVVSLQLKANLVALCQQAGLLDTVPEYSHTGCKQKKEQIFAYRFEKNYSCCSFNVTLLKKVYIFF